MKDFILESYLKPCGRGAMITAVALLFVAGSVSSAAAGGSRDGSWWVEQTPLVKCAYLLGFLDHAEFSASMTEQMRSVAAEPSMQDVAEKLDAVYELPRNRSLPLDRTIPIAVVWCFTGSYDRAMEAVKSGVFSDDNPFLYLIYSAPAKDPGVPLQGPLRDR